MAASLLRLARRRPLASALAASASAGALLSLSTAQRREEAAQASRGAARFAAAALEGAQAAVAYKLLPDEGSPLHAAAAKIVHRRSAERLLAVARAQGGMYTKIGQYLSTLTHILPAEWTETLASLQDRAPSRPWAEVKRVFEEEFGVAPEAVFSEVDEQPVASASLAQVHRCVLREGGAEVAVKIQYPDLNWIALSDLASLKIFFFIIEKAFPAYGYMWLFPEFEQSVRNELDFVQEARNGQRVAAMFAQDARVHVPAVYARHTSRRVLTMEFVHGVKPTDLAGVRALGVEPRELARAISSFFGTQVHVHGFVHCDPHAGNLLVRRSPRDGRGQLVVLDHGMYRRLSPRFRAGYCRLWKALLTRDDALGARACAELGVAPGAYDVLSLMLVQRSASSGAGLGARLSKEEVARLKDKYKDTAAQKINDFMQTLPRDLLFVSRNTNMVRGLNLALGGTARERFRVTGLCAVRGLVLTDAVEDDALLAREGRAAAGAGAGAELVSDATAMGAGLNPLTESELMGLRAGGGGGGAGGFARQARLRWEIALLEWRLWSLDVLWPMIMRGGGGGGSEEAEARAARAAQSVADREVEIANASLKG